MWNSKRRDKFYQWKIWGVIDKVIGVFDHLRVSYGKRLMKNNRDFKGVKIREWKLEFDEEILFTSLISNMLEEIIENHVLRLINPYGEFWVSKHDLWW